MSRVVFQRPGVMGLSVVAGGVVGGLVGLVTGLFQ